MKKIFVIQRFNKRTHVISTELFVSSKDEAKKICNHLNRYSPLSRYFVRSQYLFDSAIEVFEL